MKKIFIFLTLTVFFSISIYFLFSNFDTKEELSHIEDNYIDYSKYQEDEDKLHIADLLDEDVDRSSSVLDDYAYDNKNSNSLNSAIKPKENILDYEYYFHPSSSKIKYDNYRLNIESILNSDIFRSKISSIKLSFYEYEYDVRWKMKSKEIKLYSLSKLTYEEFVSVFIHELSHYIDLYYFDNTNLSDLSNNFYDISWESTKVIKSWQRQEDFVSGYSMTNKYEDFAESFTYFVLHNNDFKFKTEKSDTLKKKYNFFSRYLFKSWEFLATDFSEDNKIEDYYWDITKIEINTKKFLQYLEKSI